MKHVYMQACMHVIRKYLITTNHINYNEYLDINNHLKNKICPDVKQDHSGKHNHG